MDVSYMSAYTDYYKQLAGNSNAANVSNKINSVDASNATDDELMDVCKQFESYLLEQVFRNMEKTATVFSDEKSGMNNQLVDFFKEQTIQELAGMSTEQNSLGLAQMLYEQLKHNVGITAEQLAQNAAESGAVTSADSE